MGYTTGLANYRNFIELNQVEEQCHLLILNNSYYKAQKTECTPLWLKLVGMLIFLLKIQQERLVVLM
jgi:hypothetical protein